MAKEIKFTNEEVAELEQLRQDVSNIFTRLGQLSIERKRRVEEIDAMEEELLKQHSSLQVKESEMFKSLNEKYGDGNYDPISNTFIPAETTKEKEEEQK